MKKIICTVLIVCSLYVGNVYHNMPTCGNNVILPRENSVASVLHIAIDSDTAQFCVLR